jgi:hypothetical protein
MGGTIRGFFLTNPNFNHEKLVAAVTVHSTYWLISLV